MTVIPAEVDIQYNENNLIPMYSHVLIAWMLKILLIVKKKKKKKDLPLNICKIAHRNNE